MATVTPPWAYTLQLPHDPRAPGIARSTLRAVLRTHDMAGLTDTAELLASELVTNAYLYSSGPYTLRLRAAGSGRLRLSVRDTNPDIPAPFSGAPPVPGGDGLAESGRGLQLVRLCADSWGGVPARQRAARRWWEAAVGGVPGVLVERPGVTAHGRPGEAGARRAYRAHRGGADIRGRRGPYGELGRPLPGRERSSGRRHRRAADLGRPARAPTRRSDPAL